MNPSRDVILKDELFATENKQLIKWVCDYQQQTGLNKVLRHVKPTKVLVIVNPEYAAKLKEIEANPNAHNLNWGLTYYSPFKMLALNKKDEPLKKEIKFWANFHGDHGLFVFDTEHEANKKYNDLIWDQIHDLENERERVINSFDRQIEQLKEMFVGGSDIVLETLSRNQK